MRRLAVVLAALLLLPPVVRLSAQQTPAPAFRSNAKVKQDIMQFENHATCTQLTLRTTLPFVRKTAMAVPVMHSPRASLFVVRRLHR